MQQLRLLVTLPVSTSALPRGFVKCFKGFAVREEELEAVRVRWEVLTVLGAGVQSSSEHGLGSRLGWRDIPRGLVLLDPECLVVLWDGV